MQHLVEKTERANAPQWDVVNDAGRVLGRLAQSRVGRQGRTFYAAVGPDGCDLGRHPTIELATDAVVVDAMAGWPRSPRTPTERYRELYDAPEPPIYPMQPPLDFANS